MRQCYRHLTGEDRIVIRTLLQEDRTRQYIADALEVDVSTIKREIRRNSGLRGYRPKQAQERVVARQQIPRAKKMTQKIVAYIDKKIREDLSPEQISGTMESEIGLRVSHECIYQYLWCDKREGGELYTHLRIANGKRSRKRYGKKDWRGKIPGRVGIEKRPKIVETKRRFGDWEADLVSGAHHRGFLVTLVERKSKFTLIGHVERKTSDSVRTEIIRLLSKLDTRVLTITYDNGREFASHQDINKALQCDSYFATPYHSWERGLNENTNGLIRQYFPKKSDLRKVDAKKIKSVANRLNSRPRKTLDFKTPEEVFLQAS